MNRGVRKDILILTKLMGFMGLLIGIAGVVTPLGLYQSLVPDTNIQTPFKYLEDTSPFGFGTPPRSNFSFSRICQGLSIGPKPCPFTDTVSIVSMFPNGTVSWDFPKGIDLSVPKVITDTYSSGTDDSTTVSNFFDIQWRRYITTSDDLYNNGSEYLTGAFRSIQNLVMNNDLEAVEGLVVDTVKGGIGFRNHTIPPGFKYGVVWKEDLLFIEPETVCVDTNLTFDFSISSANNSLVKGAVITDRGGFVNLNHTFPTVDLTNPQKNPNLYERAYRAAWMQNVYMMALWNVTNPKDENHPHAFAYLDSQINKTFPIAVPNSLKFDGFGSLQLVGEFGTLVTSGSGTTGSNGAATNASDSGGANPFGIGSSNFSDISIIPPETSLLGGSNDDFRHIMPRGQCDR
jgi:hypothetical protein